MADGRYPSAVFSNKPFLRFPSTVSGTLELPGGAPSDRVDLRQQLLRARLWVLRRLRFRVQAWFRGRQRGACFLPLRGFFSLCDRPAHVILYSFIQYISWVNDNKTAWSMTAAGVAADTRVDIGPRPIPQEPMVRVSRGLLYNVHSINAPSIWLFWDP